MNANSLIKQATNIWTNKPNNDCDSKHFIIIQ